MKKTDVDFMLTLANLMSKLEQGESCAEQLQEIAKMSDENKDSISRRLHKLHRKKSYTHRCIS